MLNLTGHPTLYTHIISCKPAHMLLICIRENSYPTTNRQDGCEGLKDMLHVKLHKETDSVTSPLYPQALATASALAEARMAVEHIIKPGIIFSFLRRQMVQAIIIDLPLDWL